MKYIMQISVTNESSKTTADVPIYRGRDDVRGSVKVKSTSGALEHIGIKIELFGRIGEAPILRTSAPP